MTMPIEFEPLYKEAGLYDNVVADPGSGNGPTSYEYRRQTGDIADKARKSHAQAISRKDGRYDETLDQYASSLKKNVGERNAATKGAWSKMLKRK